MEISIIGANSYIARNFVKYVQSKNIKMYLYDINDTFKDLLYDNCSYEKISFDDYNSIKNINFKVDSIYYFVGLTGPKKSNENAISYLKVNEICLLQFLNVYIEEKSSATIIYPSTRLIYSSSRTLISEEAPKRFNSIYAITKYAAEQYLEIFHKFYNVNFCVLRLCVPYGTLLNDCTSYGTYEIFSNQAKNNGNIMVYGKGDSIRTFTHICDICEILYLCSIDKRLINDTYNIGGRTMSIYDLASIVAKKYNSKITFVDWPEIDNALEVKSTGLDSSKLDKLVDLKYRSIDDE